jgi:DNA-binding FadR family transcriptional regulator
MSRTPVREALVRLQNENLINIIPRKGAFVRVFTPDEIRHNYEVAVPGTFRSSDKKGPTRRGVGPNQQSESRTRNPPQS